MASSSLPLVLLALCGLAMTQAKLQVFSLHASGLPSDILGITDGYVKVSCGSVSLGITSVRNNNANPWWDEQFSHFKAQQNDVLRMEVYDEDLGRDDRLGVCQRRIQLGTHSHDCYLEEGGTLHYTYTLDQQ